MDLILVVPFIAMALTALRSVPPAWLALLVPIAASLPALGSKLPLRFGLVSTGIFVAVVLTVPFLFKGDAGLEEGRFPIRAADALDDSPVFHNDVVGGYLIWAQGPQRQVFIDDRAELYKGGIGEFVDIRNGREPWEPVFTEFGITEALLGAKEPMVDWLIDAGWGTVYSDDDYVVVRAKSN
jgi:hypothetical protein